MRAEKIDDYTVKLIFAGPYLSFRGCWRRLWASIPCCTRNTTASNSCQNTIRTSRRCWQQSGQPDWPTLFRQKCGDIEIPSRWAIPIARRSIPGSSPTPYIGSATQVVLRRNPYFWQVDTAGNQLPYIDTLNLKVISDIQSIVLAAIGGQLDLKVRHINTISNKPVLAQHADQGGYVLAAADFDRGRSRACS